METLLISTSAENELKQENNKEEDDDEEEEKGFHTLEKMRVCRFEIC